MSALGTLFVFSAPSGGGKTSLIEALVKSMNDLTISVSYTTRAPRPGERDGENYHFVDQEKFQALLKEKVFLEHAEVFGHWYGTSRLEVQRELNAGIDVILEIDWQGARQIKQFFPQTVGVFILPPSNQALQARLQRRAQDSETVIARRMAAAKAEMSHFNEYDYLVINDDFSTALADLQSIVRAQRLQQPRQIHKYENLIENLLR